MSVVRSIAPERGIARRCFEHYRRVALAREPRTLGEAIRRCRLREGLTQAELAQRLGVREWAVYDWELGLAQPAKNRRKLLEWMGVSENSFLNSNGGLQ